MVRQRGATGDPPQCSRADKPPVSPKVHQHSSGRAHYAVIVALTVSLHGPFSPTLLTQRSM